MKQIIYINTKNIKNGHIYWKLVLDIKKYKQSLRMKRWYIKNKTKHKQTLRDYYAKYKVGGGRPLKSELPTTPSTPLKSKLPTTPPTYEIINKPIELRWD